MKEVHTMISLTQQLSQHSAAKKKKKKKKTALWERLEGIVDSENHIA